MQEHTLTATNDSKPNDALQSTIRRSAMLALILAMLVLINYVTMPHYLWVKWPALGFGLAILGMWAAWFAGQENYENNEPKTLQDMFKVSGIMLLAAVGLYTFNMLLTPANLWVQWPLLGISVSLVIIWVRWTIRSLRG